MTDKTKLIWDNPKYAKASSTVDNITQVYAKIMLEQAGINQQPQTNPLIVLDLACGSGVVTASLQEMMSSTKRPQSTFQITCGDLADAMLDSAKDRVKSQGWTNTTVSKIDAQNIDLPSNHFTHVFTNFGPMLFPQPEKMLSECHRILQSGGICAFTTWSAVGWYNDVNSAMKSLSSSSIPNLPTLPPLDEMLSTFGNNGRWNDKEYIRTQLEPHGYGNIQIESVANKSRAENVGELKTVLEMMIGIIKSRFWTEEERNEFDGLDLNEKVYGWFVERYEDGAVEWDWVALVTTCVKV